MSEPLEFKEQKIFAGGSSLDQVVQFGSAKEATPVYSKDPDVIQQLPAFELGWQSAVLADKAPFMEEMNAVQYVLSRNIKQLQEERYQPFKPWVSTYNYAEGECVIYESFIFICVQANVGVNPLTDYNSSGGNWQTLYHNLTVGNNVYPNSFTTAITPTAGLTRIVAPLDGYLSARCYNNVSTALTKFAGVWAARFDDTETSAANPSASFKSKMRQGISTNEPYARDACVIMPVKKGQVVYAELSQSEQADWTMCRYWFTPNPVYQPNLLRLNS